MGQAYCVSLCGQRQITVQNTLTNLLNHEADEPVPQFAKRVKQHIQIHPKIKQSYLLCRTPHKAERKGVKLELYYLFQFAAYYEGEWRNGLPNGFGRIIYDDGSLYEGCFNNGVAECDQALFICGNGNYYRGRIKNNMANGYGELSTQKLFYKGNWVNDLPNGKARQIYNNYSYFQGNFINGIKQGLGFYQWNKQQTYGGGFKANQLDGKGQLITKTYIYKGDFKNGKKNGIGIYKDKLGFFTYEGCFAENKPKGNGIVKYDDKTIFKGIFNGFQRRSGMLYLTSGQNIEIDTDNDQIIEKQEIQVHNVESSDEKSSKISHYNK